MADAPGGLTYVLDENAGGLLNVLRVSRAPRFEQVRSLEELGIPRGTLDPALLIGLGQRGPHALVTRDGSMLEPLIQRGAWREAGVTLFMLGKGWGKMPLSELSRRVLFLWPNMVAQAGVSRRA